MLHYRIAPDKEGLQRQFEENGLPIGVGDLVLPILISLEQWKELFSPRDEEIMCYALRKTAEEVFLHDEKGLVVSIENDLSLVLLYHPLPLLESAGKDGVKRLAERYNAFCVDNFKCSVSCYIAAPVPALQLTAVYESLLSAEKANVINTCGVIAIDEEKPLQPAQLHLSPSFADWSILLEQDKEEELLSKLDVNMEKLRSEGADQESLNAFYYGFIHLLYQVFHKKGVLIRDVFGPNMLAELYQYPRSIIQLQNNVSLLMTEAARFLVQYHKGKSALLVKVQQYIEEHIMDDFSREDIAGYVFLNPAYLSRWFKKGNWKGFVRLCTGGQDGEGEATAHRNEHES